MRCSLRRSSASQVGCLLAGDASLNLCFKPRLNGGEAAVPQHNGEVLVEPAGELHLNLGDGFLREIHVRHGEVAGLLHVVSVETEGVGRVALLVNVEKGRRVPFQSEGRGDADAGGGLAATALLVGEDDGLSAWELHFAAFFEKNLRGRLSVPLYRHTSGLYANLIGHESPCFCTFFWSMPLQRQRVCLSTPGLSATTEVYPHTG